MDTKIVFFDIDGTIYSYEKGIPKDTAKAIELLQTGLTMCFLVSMFQIW